MELLNGLLDGLRQHRPSLLSPGAHIRLIALGYLPTFLVATLDNDKERIAEETLAFIRAHS